MFLTLRELRQRFYGFPPLLQRVFLTAAMFNCLWLLGTLWAFSRSTSQLLFALQLDKAMHFGGGIFVAGLVMMAGWAHERRQYLIWALAVGVLWEIWEVLFLADQREFFRMQFFGWFFDSGIDLVADMLGAYWWVNLGKVHVTQKTA